MRTINRKSYLKLFVFILLTIILCNASANVFAQDYEAAAQSKLSGANLPRGAVRLFEQVVPGEINDVLQKLINQSGAVVKRGDTEVLAWTENFKQSNVPQIIKQVTDNFRAAGWEYEEMRGDVTVFSLSRTVPTKRIIVGLYTYDDKALVVALTEMLRADAPTQVKTNGNTAKTNQDSSVGAVSNSSAKVVTAEKNAKYVNLMGTEMPPMPSFPQLAPKPGKVRGYVKDWTGKPLAGAQLGIRASYLAGYYTGGQGVTDANGYYEFAPPKGMAHFYNAGYQIEWGDGVAAVSLHPVDGKLDSFVTMDGAVENFVMLPYGIVSREAYQENPYVPQTYYGGSVYITYWMAERSDNRPYAGSLLEDSIIEVTLTPENGGKSFVVRQPVGPVGNLTIQNIPITDGRYKITIKNDGKPLKIKENRKFSEQFGMSPAETIGTGSILFIPSEAKASMVGPQNGAWNWISLGVETQ